MSIELTNKIIIFDESHNIETASRSCNSAEITIKELNYAYI